MPPAQLLPLFMEHYTATKEDQSFGKWKQ